MRLENVSLPQASFVAMRNECKLLLSIRAVTYQSGCPNAYLALTRRQDWGSGFGLLLC